MEFFSLLKGPRGTPDPAANIDFPENISISCRQQSRHRRSSFYHNRIIFIDFYAGCGKMMVSFLPGCGKTMVSCGEMMFGCGNRW